MSTSTIEIDQHTKAGHERFKKQYRFSFDGARPPMTWDEWMEWQATRDPIADDPTEADRLRKNFDEQIKAERRGPGISRRPVKKATAHKPKNATDKKAEA